MAKECFQYCTSKHAGIPLTTLSVTQLKNALYATRAREYASWESLIAAHPLRSVSDTDERFFMQFNLLVPIDGPKGQEFTKIIGWGNPDLIHLVKAGKVHLFCDMTFKIVPKGFSQVLIVMIYSQGEKTYVPIFYVLLQSKAELAYYHALQMVICACNWELDPKSITCDFEVTFINALRTQFRGVDIVGCFFHFKQALRRKLKKFRIDPLVISSLMNDDGLINILTIVPVSEILIKAIPYIRAHFPEGAYKDAFNQFWSYFEKTWMNRYDPASWNISHLLKDAEGRENLINRTNNPLERFNRRLNDLGLVHPSMVQFVSAIKTVSAEYVEDIALIRRNVSKKPVHKACTIHTVPDNYANWRPTTASKKRAKK